ncbi:hypothetical protein RhiTH_011276 [Rhizoctonia solani]
MSIARPTRTPPLVKLEESATDAENLLHLGHDVSEADVELLLNFRRDGAQARVSTPPTSASRVSISALLNTEMDDTSMPTTTPRSVTVRGPASPHLSTSGSLVSPSHPPPLPRTPSRSDSKSSVMAVLVSSHKPQLTLERNLDRETKSMSISAEPESALPSPSLAPIPAALPTSTPTPTQTIPVSTSRSRVNSAFKPPKVGKGRGRVSKGPKKRQGKGWIIESCTTSGAPSEADPGSDSDQIASNLATQTPQIDDSRKPIILKQLHEIFDGDSDLTDLDDLDDASSSSSGEEETQEYDPGLAGLPPVPASSDSEYAPRHELLSRSDGVAKRARRTSRASLDYGAFQSSARPSVRLATRTPTVSTQKRDGRVKKTKTANQESASQRNRRALKDAVSPFASGSRSVKPSARGKAKSKPASSSGSSVSLGEWHEDKPVEMRTTLLKRTFKGKGKTKEDSGTSTLTELTESSPSLGGGKSLLGSSPIRRMKDLMMSDAANLSARSDGGVTHVSGSVGEQNDDSGEEERLRRVRKFQGADVDQGSDSDQGELDQVQVRDFVYEGPTKRRMSEPGRGRGQLGGPLRRSSSPIKPSSSIKPSRRRTSVEVVIPSKPKRRRSSFPEPNRNTSPSRARLVKAVVAGSSSTKPQQVYVLLPEPVNVWTSALAQHTSEESSVTPSEDYSMEGSNLEDALSNGVTAESRSEQSEEPPLKRAKSSTSGSTDVRQAKGKGRATGSGRGSSLPRGRGGRQPRLESRLSESTEHDRAESLNENEDMLSTIEEGRPTRSSRSRKVAKSADADSSLGIRPKRQAKPTTRALESAQQEEDEWGKGGRIMGTMKRSPGARASKLVVHVEKTRPASEEWSAKESRSTGKRAVAASEEPRPAKRSRKSQAGASSSHALVELHRGDYILRPQNRRCWNYNFDQDIIPRCVACKKKKFGDTCRFINVRWFQFKAPTSDPVGAKFQSPHEEDNQEKEEPAYHLPYTWNITPEIEQVERMRLGIARALYPVLKEELAHASKSNVIRRAIEIEPVTRFSRKELEQTVADMEALIKQAHKNAPVPGDGSASRASQAQIANWASRVPPWNPTSPHASTEPPALSSAGSGSSRDVSSPRGTPDPLLSTMPTIASPTMSPTHDDQFSPEAAPLLTKRPTISHHGRLDPASVPSRSLHHFVKDLSEEEFKPLWARGEAIVVQDLLDRFELDWTPEYFISEYGEQRCMVVNCENNKDQEMIVKDFFEMFGKTDREGVLKLKDWPAQADFKDDFPKLYDDFMKALPVPNYTRRDGILNLAAHFATNAIAPDLGPKMYNAFTSSEGPGGQGSTRLHMDMADAVNIMMYASDCPDGSPGVAAWDIFRACDSEKIRSYLRRHFKDRASEFRDPIHSQLFYLDSHHRKKLYEEEHVYSWRIYQRPGDAVFIPAGCAHQVCNLADCIKIAIDFVSIENIDRCEKLTTEFRNENDTFTWKEDVLQLRTMMMYAWRSTTQLGACWYSELAKGQEGESSDSSLSADS